MERATLESIEHVKLRLQAPKPQTLGFRVEGRGISM